MSEPAAIDHKAEALKHLKDAEETTHDHRELVAAAVAYAQYAGQDHWCSRETPPGWPFEMVAWKPTGDPVRDLTKAGALIAAEIDRLQRHEQVGGGQGGD